MNKKANLNQAFKELRKLGYFARQNFSLAVRWYPKLPKRGRLLHAVGAFNI